MNKLTEFAQVFRLYARHHPIPYAVQRAWEITFRNIPF